MNDYISRYSAYNDTVRLFVITSTTTCNTATQTHDLWPSASVALGRTLSIGAIMSVMNKNDEKTTIRVDGGGPLKGIVVDSKEKGKVRGYVGDPHQHFTYNTGGINCSYAVGTNGHIHVTRDLNLKEPFTSSTDIQTGEIAEDFTYYFVVSEQVPTAISAGIIVEEDNSVSSAGAIIVQIMPGCSEETLSKVEENVANLETYSSILSKNLKHDEIASLVIEEYKLLEEIPVSFDCDCSKEKFSKGLSSLGKEQLLDILEKDGELETFCHFCSSKYKFDEDDIINITK